MKWSHIALVFDRSTGKQHFQWKDPIGCILSSTGLKPSGDRFLQAMFIVSRRLDTASVSFYGICDDGRYHYRSTPIGDQLPGIPEAFEFRDEDILDMSDN